MGPSPLGPVPLYPGMMNTSFLLRLISMVIVTTQVVRFTVQRFTVVQIFRSSYLFRYLIEPLGPGNILYLSVEPLVFRKPCILRQVIYFPSQFTSQSFDLDPLDRLQSLDILKTQNLHGSPSVSRSRLVHKPLSREPWNFEPE